MAFSNTRHHTVSLGEKGLNIAASPIEVGSGAMVAVFNHCLTDVPKGITRIKGYERIDGHYGRPSETFLYMITGTHGTNAVAGEIVSGSISGTEGLVVSGYPLADGLPGLYLAVSEKAGVFLLGESVLKGSPAVVVVSNIAEPVEARFVDSGLPDTQYLKLLEESNNATRSRISPVPCPAGESLIGAFFFNEKYYAVSNGGSMFVSSPITGWSPVILPTVLAFSSGVIGAGVLGDIVTGAVSNATATLVRLKHDSGTFGVGGNATGSLYVKNIVGTFQNGENVTIATSQGTPVGEMLLASGAGQFTIGAGIFLRTVRYNFGGAEAQETLFFTTGGGGVFAVNSVGDVVPVWTGVNLAISPPATQITAANNHLFVSYGSVFLCSPIGNPFSPWVVIHGSEQFAMGDKVTAFSVSPGGTLIVGMRDKISVLYGTSAADFSVKTYTDSSGVLDDTLVSTLGPTGLSASGIFVMSPSERWGDFEWSKLSDSVEGIVKQYIKDGRTFAVAFTSDREYRLYKDNMCLRLKTGAGRFMGFTTDYYPLNIRNLIIYDDKPAFVSDKDNFVYLLDSGNSFDGEPVFAMVALSPEHVGRPRHKKKWFNLFVERVSASFRIPSVFDIVVSDENLYSFKSMGMEDFHSLRARPAMVKVSPETGRFNLSLFSTGLFAGVSREVAMSNTLRLNSTSPFLQVIFSSSNIMEEPYTIRLLSYRYAIRNELRGAY